MQITDKAAAGRRVVWLKQIVHDIFGLRFGLNRFRLSGFRLSRLGSGLRCGFGFALRFVNFGFGRLGRGLGLWLIRRGTLGRFGFGFRCFCLRGRYLVVLVVVFIFIFLIVRLCFGTTVFGLVLWRNNGVLRSGFFLFVCFVFRAYYDFFRFDGAVRTPNFHTFVFGRGLRGLGVAGVGFGIERTDNANNQCADGNDGNDESGADKVFRFELERFVLFFGHRSMCEKVDGDGRDVVPALWIRAALFGLGVVLIQGNDFLYADGGADAAGYLLLLFGCQYAHDVSNVAVSYDFDTSLCGGFEA